MKIIGIEIEGAKAIFCAIEKKMDGSFGEITGDFTSLTIQDDKNCLQVREFQSTVCTFFDHINPDKIAIVSRNPKGKGKFATSPISFKLEGLLQCYLKQDIIFVAPQTLSSFFKKNASTFSAVFKYQVNAAKLSEYLALC
jgi:hypothetical protein